MSIWQISATIVILVASGLGILQIMVYREVLRSRRHSVYTSYFRAKFDRFMEMERRIQRCGEGELASSIKRNLGYDLDQMFRVQGLKEHQWSYFIARQRLELVVFFLNSAAYQFGEELALKEKPTDAEKRMHDIFKLFTKTGGVEGITVYQTALEAEMRKVYTGK